MDKIDIFYFVEEVMGMKLMEWQKEVLLKLHEARETGLFGNCYIRVTKESCQDFIKKAIEYLKSKGDDE